MIESLVKKMFNPVLKEVYEEGYKDGERREQATH